MQLTVTLTFSATVIGVWRMLSTKSQLNVNKTSLLVKQLLSLLNFVSDIMVYLKFTNLAESIFGIKATPSNLT